MKKYLITACAAALVALSFGTLSCSSGKPTLHVYTWADYLDPDVVKDFEKANGCRVVLDYFDSNETMYAKIKAGASGYDVIFPTSYQAAIMYEEGLLHQLDHDALVNRPNIDPKYLKRNAIDADMLYSVPYMLGTTGIGYRVDVLPDLKPSWSVFMNPVVKGRSTLLNDMRETMGAALLSLGYSVNSVEESEIAAAAEVVKQWKREIAKFENEQYKPGLASGEFLLVHGYSGDISQVIADNPDANIRYVLPEEGFMVWCDDMVIPADAPNVEMAEAFLDFFMDPEIAARNMEFTLYKAPNQSAYALVSDELKNDPSVFVPDNLMEKSDTVRLIGDAITLYSKYWDQIKASE